MSEVATSLEIEPAPDTALSLATSKVGPVAVCIADEIALPADTCIAVGGEDPSAVVPVKKKRTDRTVEVVFRNAYREQLELTALADSKANIMIHINGLMLSIMLASAGFITTARPWLLLPSGILTLASMLSLVLAVLAARPKLRKPTMMTVDDVYSGRANILFFGNFGRLTEDEFVHGMREMFEDTDRMHLNMTRHIHGMGHVLLKKFRLLRVSYTLFLIGLLLSSILFLVTLVASSAGGA